MPPAKRIQCASWWTTRTSTGSTTPRNRKAAASSGSRNDPHVRRERVAAVFGNEWQTHSAKTTHRDAQAILRRRVGHLLVGPCMLHERLDADDGACVRKRAHETSEKRKAGQIHALARRGHERVSV